MADNYLEKQMEQYEARKAAWERQKKYKSVKALTTQKKTAKNTVNNAAPVQD